ncbi:hypothetical protein NQ317_005482, partial [Molorchus minor]
MFSALIRKVNDDKVFEDDEKLKCYIKCMFVTGGCMNEEGIMDEETAIAVMNQDYRDIVVPMVKDCGTKIGTTPCENAWLTAQCWAKHSPD